MLAVQIEADKVEIHTLAQKPTKILSKLEAAPLILRPQDKNEYIYSKIYVTFGMCHSDRIWVEMYQDM